MPRKINIFGGGTQTNHQGLLFEQSTSLNDPLKNNGFEIYNNYEVYYNDNFFGISINQTQFSTIFLKSKGIDYRNYNSKRWDPDETLINEINKTVYIIEKNFSIVLVLLMKNQQLFFLKFMNTKNQFVLLDIQFNIYIYYLQNGLVVHNMMITTTSWRCIIVHIILIFSSLAVIGL